MRLTKAMRDAGARRLVPRDDGGYDVHFERLRLWSDDLPCLGPLVIAALRPAAERAGLRVEWDGRQRHAIRLVPWRLPRQVPPRMRADASTVELMLEVLPGFARMACREGRDWAMFWSSPTAALDEVEAEATTNPWADGPCHARWAARMTGGQPSGWSDAVRMRNFVTETRKSVTHLRELFRVMRGL